MKRLALALLLGACSSGENDPSPSSDAAEEHGEPSAHDPSPSATKADDEARRLTQIELDRLQAKATALAERNIAHLRAEAARRKAAEDEAAKIVVPPDIEQDVRRVVEQCDVHHDPYLKSTWLKGPLQGGGMLRLHVETKRLQLYSVGDLYNDHANDDGGKSFHVIEINRPWSGDSAALLSPEYLRERSVSGIRIKFWGGRRENVVALSSAYVLGFRIAMRDLEGPPSK